MRNCFDGIGGREGLSRRAIEICKIIADYKNTRMAIIAIGRMARLYQVAKADAYWTEKANLGRNLEYYAIKAAKNQGGDFNKAIDAFGDEKR